MDKMADDFREQFTNNVFCVGEPVSYSVLYYTPYTYNGGGGGGGGGTLK